MLAIVKITNDKRVNLLEGIPATEEFYDPKEMWQAAALQPMQAVIEAHA